MQRRSPDFGKATAPRAFDAMVALHELDLHATYQGGLDYYFSEEPREECWTAAHLGLRQLGLDALEATFLRAREAFRTNEQAREDEFSRVGDAAFERDESAYLREMASINADWRRDVALLHAKLAAWREINGLE